MGLGIRRMKRIKKGLAGKAILGMGRVFCVCFLFCILVFFSTKICQFVLYLILFLKSEVVSLSFVKRLFTLEIWLIINILSFILLFLSYNIFFYLSSSGIASCVGTAGTMMLHLHLNFKHGNLDHSATMAGSYDILCGHFLQHKKYFKCSGGLKNILVHFLKISNKVQGLLLIQYM